MTVSVFILGALLLFLLAGAFPMDDNNSQLIVFKTPAFILLSAALALNLLQCCWKHRGRLSIRRLGFQLTHLGMALTMAGAFIGYMKGDRVSFSVPLVKHIALNRFHGADGNAVEFAFKITASDFVVNYYPPQYALYRPSRKEKDDYEYLGTVKVSEETDILDLKEAGKVPLHELHREKGWRRAYVLTNGYALRLAPATPKHFEALLHLFTEDGEEMERKVMVNHPVNFQDWRFYLSGYDKQMRRYIILSARRDPGRNIVLAGLWTVIAGVPLICFAKAGEVRE